MGIIRKVTRWIFKILEAFAMLCMVVLTVIVFMDVILRYVFRHGFSWSQEVATLMLVWFSMIGIAIGVLEKIHISIEMFTSGLPEKALKALISFNHILIAAYGAMMLYFGIRIMDTVKNATLPATKLPSSVMYVFLPLSGILILLNAVLVATRQDKKIVEEGKEEIEPAVKADVAAERKGDGK